VVVGAIHRSESQGEGEPAGGEGVTGDGGLRKNQVGGAGVGQFNGLGVGGSRHDIPKTHARWHNRSLGGVDAERGGVAGDTSGGVADHHREQRSVVGAGRGRGGVTGRGRATDRHTVFLPLIAERGGARGGHAEGGCLASGDRLAGGLRRDRRG